MRFFDLFKKKNNSTLKKQDDLTLDTDINCTINRINKWVDGGEDKELDKYMKNIGNPNYDDSPILNGSIANSDNDIYSLMVCDRQHYYVVYKSGNRKFKDKLERPNNGKIVDNGTFIIEDWMNDEESCCGTFYAFNSNNEILLKHIVNANIFNSDISDDGKFACMQTCNSNDTNDSNQLFFFNIENSQLLWKKHMISGWADNYTIDTITNTLTLHYKNLSIDYDFNGNIKDEKAWKKQRINILQPYQLKSLAEDLIKTHTANINIYENEIIELLTVAESKGVSNYQLAQCYRWLGEAFLTLNNESKTIKYFDKALKLYPRIGVKKLYLKLTSKQ